MANSKTEWILTNLEKLQAMGCNGDALPERTYEVPFCAMSWRTLGRLQPLYTHEKKTWGHVSFLCEPSIDHRELLANVLYDFNSRFKFSSTSYLFARSTFASIWSPVRCPLCTRNQLRKYAEEQNLHRQRGDIEPGHCHVGHQLSCQAIWCWSYDSRSTKQINENTYNTHLKSIKAPQFWLYHSTYRMLSPHSSPSKKSVILSVFELTSVQPLPSSSGLLRSRRLRFVPTPDSTVPGAVIAGRFATDAGRELQQWWWPNQKPHRSSVVFKQTLEGCLICLHILAKLKW